ncbi:MAG: hypothetical protein ACR2GR_06725, partial [Rhodothermales bacterium]
ATLMSLYKPKKASIDETEGRGYAFSKKTVFGKAFQGVIFVEGDEENIDAEELKEDEEATFTGTVYDRSREKEDTFPITVTNVVSTPSGERIDFVMKEEEE